MSKASNKSDVKESCYSQATVNSHHSHSIPNPKPHKRKLEHPEQGQRNTLRQPKGPAYWDNLSRIWLTRGALKELDRRNSNPEYYRLAIPQFGTNQEDGWKPQFASDFLRDCAPRCLKQLKRLSRQGGLNLSELRNVYDLPLY